MLLDMGMLNEIQLMAIMCGCARGSDITLVDYVVLQVVDDSTRDGVVVELVLPLRRQR